MKIAIELYQILPESSGGIVPQLHNLLSRAFVLYPAVDFLVYVTSRSYRPAEPVPPNVRVIILSEANFWNELDQALLHEQVEVLFRTYPSVENPLFPTSRQIGLIPDLQHELMPELFSPAVLQARRQSFPALINKAGAICVYSEYSQQILQQHYPNSPAEIVLVPPGSSLELLQSELALSPSEVALIPQERFFLYPANLWPHKNHRRLCAALEIALAQIPEKISLVLTGDPAGWAELEAEYPHLPLRHLGFVSPALLQALYRQALALTYFSLYEGFGMPLLEAFGFGTPVLSSNLAVLQEVGGKAILSCDPNQPQAIAELMIRISQEADLRQALIAEGHQQAQHYNGDESSRNFVEACQRLAARPVENTVYVQTLEAALIKLADTQQQVVDKEQVMVGLEAANQERLALLEQLNRQSAELQTAAAARLDLINQLNIQSAELQTTAAARLDLINRLNMQNAELQTTAAARLDLINQLSANLEELNANLKLQQTRLELSQLELEGRGLQLAKLDAQFEALQAHFEQTQADKAGLAAELEVIQRRARGGDPAAINGVLDNPAETVTWRGWAVINGWAFSLAGGVVSVEAFLEDKSIGFIAYGIPRPDVAKTHDWPGAANCGFGSSVRLSGSIAPGEHQLRVQVSDEASNQQNYYRTIKVRSESRVRKVVKARPGETVRSRLVSYVGVRRRQELNYKAHQNLTYWKNRLFHYHLGILQQHTPKPWLIPTHYTRAKPPISPPSISIVTPSYNQAAFLERTLRSVLDQNYPNLQYIVQDGGSKDASPTILQKYTSQLAYWESNRDKGQSNALNMGFQRSTGEIMAYLNSDDLLLPGTLNYVANYFEQHPQIDVVYGHRVIIDEHDREIGRWIVPPHEHNQSNEADILSWADYIPQETMFWRRRIWEKAGGQIDESFQFAMDWDLILRFRAANARFMRLPRFLGAFRVHSTQKSSAQIADLGTREMNRLRERSLGWVPVESEIHPRTLPYLRKHVRYHKLYRLKILRY